jgi:hypothetical protein
MLPSGAEPVFSATVLDQPKEPDPRLAAPTALTLLSTRAEGALFEITYRRGAAPTELRDWRAEPGSAQQGLASQWHRGLSPGKRIRFPLFADTDVPLPLTEADADRLGLGAAANFCGGYIEHAFSEDQETWIDVDCGRARPNASVALVHSYRKDEKRPLPPEARSGERAWWFETTFHLPFLYQIGAEPAFYDHTLAVFPLLRPRSAKEVRAWVNGGDLPVRLYAYPRNRKLGCYYTDLVGTAAHGGENRLVVHVQF